MDAGRWSSRIAVVAAAFVAVAGCRQIDKHNVNIPVVEEFKAPPHEERFDAPPEQGYRKPAPKKEFKPGFGGPNGPGGGGGASMGNR